ncbi:hypothetical protein IQ07DRAFT_498406 [Pyrenochaeta sp. DS3sAY3a]|nr:hypothetical protein IQ07DRAFT_498406 [Pyrenochaeta sp. DS3sAY3a]
MTLNQKANQKGVFRFRDLPGEVRNKIYKNLLCDFAAQSNIVQLTDMYNYERPRHATDTAILSTSKDTYNEAYDIMVKTNRFVHITSVAGVPVRHILLSQRVPIVSDKVDIVNKFQGFVLALHVDSHSPQVLPPDGHKELAFLQPCNLMILHRDLEIFCRALGDIDSHPGGNSRDLKLSITIGPCLDVVRPGGGTATLRDFFSDKTQKTLVAPLEKELRGYHRVEVSGHVDRDVASALRSSLLKPRWSGSEAVLQKFLDAKKNAGLLFIHGEHSDATLLWQDTTLDIDLLHESNSWPGLVREGGESFVSRLVEAYFAMRINIAHVQIAAIKKDPSLTYLSGIMGEDSLNQAAKAMEKDYWMDGYEYKPPTAIRHKLLFRLAVLYRLQGDPKNADAARMYINTVARAQPNDDAIAQEKRKIAAWRDQVRGANFA